MTNLHTSRTVSGLGKNFVAAEQQAMANANKSGTFNEEGGIDPIAAALKQMHDDVANEALPDEFLRLLDEIDSKIAADKAAH